MVCQRDLDMDFADEGFKIHRTGGKLVISLVMLSTKSLLIVDGKTFKVKARHSIQSITGLLFSPFDDGIVVIHMCAVNNNANKHNGDIILNVDHAIELASKLFLSMEKRQKNKSKSQLRKVSN